MIEIRITDNLQNVIDRLNKINLDQQTAMAEAAEATALKLQEINPEYAVVNVETDGDTFVITANHIGYTDEINEDAKDFFKQAFRESLNRLIGGSNGN